MKKKITLELDEEMISNLALMGGHLSHQEAADHAAEDIKEILRNRKLSLPVKGGRLRVGVMEDESKVAWIEFQRDDWCASAIDLTLVDTEFSNEDFTVLIYEDPHNEEYTSRAVISKKDVLDAVDAGCGRINEEPQ